ncbi:hypothetical protein JKF63_04811 [Porcisia hertigi]|uniref:Uncharacterized protein n=1 Tax=Porcisia hertigi TaxID=2761500 RepID=A0A836IFI1_9TRYP|nr:hypothetical protein JKF63_04811 [Porcisia hertigi]
MNATWQSSLDRTLRSTVAGAAALEQLQHRRANYDRARRKMDDYLGPSPKRGDDQPALDLLDQDLSLPPPLPQHLRYHAERVTGPSPPAHSSLDDSTPIRRPSLLSSSPLQLLNAQVRGVLLELELEKAKRADSVRELAFRTTAEIAEMRSLITQLQTENGTLKKSVHALEGRLGFEGRTDGLRKSVANGGVTPADGAYYTSLSVESGPPTKSSMAPSTIANTGFGLPHKMPFTAGEATSLVARVEALEAGFARQQQHSEDRQTRLTGTLRELVKSEVGAELTQVRALAREAARDSTEDLLKLRLSALESSTRADVEKALRSASASEALAQQAQQQCRETEQRLSSHIHKLQAQVAERQGQERIALLESRVDDQLSGMQSQLRQCRADVEVHVDRLLEERKSLSGVVQRKSEAAGLLAMNEHLEETHRGGGSGWMSREQVTALLQTQLQQALDDEVRKMHTMAQENLDNADTWRRNASMRLAALETHAENTHSAVTQQEKQWETVTRDIQQVRADLSSVQSRVSEATRHAKTELADVWEAHVQALEDRTQKLHRERQQQTDTQLRQLQQTLAEHQEALQRARVAGESAEERLKRVETALAAAEATLPRAVEDARVKHEALQSVVQQACVLPLSRVQQDIEAAQRKLQAVEEDRARLNSNWMQQLMEARQYHEERARHTREVLEQRLVHQKELYEELRTQQTLQRRTAEDQHQQLMDRVRHIQGQQQHTALSVVTPTHARERPADVDSASALAMPLSSTAAEVSVFEDYQRTLQGLLGRLEALDDRVGSVEGVSAKVPHIVADATAAIAARLEGLQDRVQATSDDWRRQHEELKRETELQLRTLSKKCSETEASIDAHATRTTRQLEQSLSPLELVSHLSTDKPSLQRLAIRLQEHLALTPDNTAAIDGMRAQLATQAKALEALHTWMQDSKQIIAGLSDLRLADQASAAAPSSNTEVHPAGAADGVAAREEALNAVGSLQVALEEQRKRQDDLEVLLRNLTAQELARVTRELVELKRATDRTSLELATLADQYSALQSLQRQQLPTLQKYVHDVVEVVESNQSTQLDLVQLRLRAVEDHHKHLQARLEEYNATHEAEAAQRAQDLLKKMNQEQKEHKAIEEQLTSLRDDVAATRADVDSFGRHMAAAKEARERMESLATALQPAASPVPAEETYAVAQKGEVGESTQHSAGLPLILPVASVAELHSLFEKLDERLTLLEEQTQESVSMTSEMLGAFRDQLQNVVGRFSDAAARHTEEPRATEGDMGDALAAETAVAVTESILSFTQLPIRNLEDVFLFLLHGLHKLHQALSQLQSNTVDTLEILEQHEESVALLPMLQHTVDVMSATFLPLAEQLGVDTGALRTVPEQQQARHRHYVSLFPPPRSSSSSSSGGGGGGGGGGSSDAENMDESKRNCLNSFRVDGEGKGGE